MQCKSSRCPSGRRRSAWNVDLAEPIAVEAAPLPGALAEPSHGKKMGITPEKALKKKNMGKKHGKKSCTGYGDVNDWWENHRTMAFLGVDFLLNRYAYPTIYGHIWTDTEQYEH